MSQNNFRHGPEILDHGIRFSLWAPSAHKVDLIIDKNFPEPMQPIGEGAYQCVSSNAHVGSRYHFLIDGIEQVADPASVFQPDDVVGQSEIIDLKSLPKGPSFVGRPWAETVIYELHVGTFSPEGTYEGIEKKLDYLKDLGITAIELMPLNDVPGSRSWGYDGVLLNAPNAAYGTPQELKKLINAAHARGLMVFLDVVYNHFGPAENHVRDYAKEFFSTTHDTGWGPAVNLEGENGQFVRGFLIQNALQWLNDYEFDGLRFDAVHALKDDSPRHFLLELAETIRSSTPGRHIHLMLENEANQARYLERVDGKIVHYSAQWGDDFHNALHVLLTNEDEGYYKSFSDKPLQHLARSLTESFAYQGEIFPLKGDARGEPSAHLPPEATIFFAQNHDQIGNRGLGERLSQLVDDEKLRQAMALVMLSPHIPMIFMGEEAAVTSPFLFFCNWEGELAESTRKGRLKEFSHFSSFSTPEMQEKLPDSNAFETFQLSKLNWDEIKKHKNILFKEATQELLQLRHKHIVPMIKEGFRRAKATTFGLYPTDQQAIDVRWQTDSHSELQIITNFSNDVLSMPLLRAQRLIFNSHPKQQPSTFLYPKQLIALVS